jgi:NAD(P)-dependent dehydrogenase (short-subunit alcohol dehydrogenase family)
MNALSTKTAFVTGGGSGIGRALSKALSARGITVAVTDVDHDAAARVAQECGPRAVAAALDVRDPTAVREAIERFAAEHGRLDYVFNNAGIGTAGEVDDIPLDAWRRIVDINLYGVLHGVLAAYPLMLKQGFGHIVNTASLAGLGPAPLFAPYALTKHAVVGLSTSLRIEAAARGVRVSVFCPAAVETPILDSMNPAEFGINSAPDARRFLTALAGAPYSVEHAVAELLVALDANHGVIVLPARARLAWRLGRWFPALVEKLSLSAVAAERKALK